MIEGLDSSGSDELGRIARAMELRDAGHDDWLQRACEGRPELEPHVLAAVDAAATLPEHFAEAGTADARIGTVLDGRYRISERLGAGAMGVVYEADDARLGRPVAVKVLRPGSLDRERDFKRFEREARALAAVGHPAVVTIFDRGQASSGESYLVMERLEGCSLHSIVEELDAEGLAPDEVRTEWIAGRFGLALNPGEGFVRTAVRWVAEVASGVARAHAAGLVHRDVKPSNVFVRTDGTAALLDFGIARVASSEALTEDESSLGTPAYMAPECVGGGDSASPRSDVYGLAAVLYSLLSLRAPYSGTPTKILLSAVSRDPAPLQRLHPGLPRDLVAIVEKGMERAPGRRYSSAEALREDLEAFLDHRPVGARPIGPLRRRGRQLARSRVARGALGSLALVLALVIGLAVRDSVASARSERWTAVARELPPNFAILRPENRVLLHAADRDALGSRLDRMVALAVDPLPSRLLRAAFLLDHGEARAAALDMEAIARHEGTPLARALASAYGAVGPDSAGSAAVELSALPEPVGTRDRYLRAFHHLRAFEDPQASALLDEQVRSELPHAEELAFALVGFGRLDATERNARAMALQSDVRLLEARLGGRTATTAHFLAFARAHARDYLGGLEAARESVALAPRTHVNRTNAAWCAFALGRFDEAREHIAVALDVRPNDFRPAQTLVWTWIAEGEFDRAHEAIERVGPPLDGIAPWWSAQFGLLTETYRALALWGEARDADLDPLADEAFTAALDAAGRHLDSARALGAANPAPLAQALLEGLATNRDQAVFDALVRDYAGEPRGLWSLRLVERHVPEGIPPESVGGLRSFLSSLHDELSGALVVPQLRR